MLRKIILENYMSHERTEIDLAPGLTVLAGPNNCGKSAVVSALQTLCGDHNGDFMVRHGQRECSVTVETDDGHIITWRRKGKALSYTIDGETTSRGRAPDKLCETLRLEKVQPAERKEPFDVHFGKQKSPIFLINSPSDTAAFFSTSSDAERLLEVQHLHREKTRNARSAERAVSEEIAGFDKRLTALGPLEEIGPKLEEIEAEHQALWGQTSEIEALRLIIEKLEQVEHRRLKCEATLGALKPLAGPPALADLAPIGGVLEQIDRIAAAAVKHRATLAAIKPLCEPPALADEAPLATSIERIGQCARQQARAAREIEAVGRLHEPPAIEDPRPLREFGKKLKSAMGRAEGAVRVSRALAELREPPAIADPAALADAVKQVAAALKRKTDLATTLKLRADALEGVERQAADLAAAHPTCPTCGAAITDAKRLLSGGHAHA